MLWERKAGTLAGDVVLSSEGLRGRGLPFPGVSWDTHFLLYHLTDFCLAPPDSQHKVQGSCWSHSARLLRNSQTEGGRHLIQMQPGRGWV